MHAPISADNERSFAGAATQIQAMQEQMRAMVGSGTSGHSIPDSKSSMVTTLKEKDHASAPDGCGVWRENLELQLGGTEIGMEKVLVMVRDSADPFEKALYESCLVET